MSGVRSGNGGPNASSALVRTHLFQLEALLTALEEVTAGRGLDQRAVVDLACLTGVDPVMLDASRHELERSLAFASLLCNSALSALSGQPQSAIEIGRLQELILALTDLVEVALYRSDYPVESEHAFRELLVLLGLSPTDTRRHLMSACFGVAARVATHAIGTLQTEMGAFDPLADL